MKFPYIRCLAKPTPAFPRQYSIYRPLIPVRIIANNKVSPRYLALVDSGADTCLFHSDLLKAVDVNLTSGIEHKFFGITDKPLKGYFHYIVLEIGGFQLKTRVAFSSGLRGEYGLLGRNGFFNLFTVILNEERKYLELKPKSKTST